MGGTHPFKTLNFVYNKSEDSGWASYQCVNLKLLFYHNYQSIFNKLTEVEALLLNLTFYIQLLFFALQNIGNE